MRSTVHGILVVAFLVGTVVTTSSALADRYWRCNRTESYSALKLGVYSPTATGAPDGFFGGLEGGVALSPQLDVGLTGDYFYRGRSAGPVESANGGPPYDIPVHESFDMGSSSVHLAMLGVGGRLRFPVGLNGPAPFVQGGILFQLLHLTSMELEELGGNRYREVERSDTFWGFGWQAGAGMDIPLDGRTGLVAEFGYVHAEPQKTIDEPGYVRTTLTAEAGGAFVRGGVRFSY